MATIETLKQQQILAEEIKEMEEEVVASKTRYIVLGFRDLSNRELGSLIQNSNFVELTKYHINRRVDDLDFSILFIPMLNRKLHAWYEENHTAINNGAYEVIILRDNRHKFNREDYGEGITVVRQIPTNINTPYELIYKLLSDSVPFVHSKAWRLARWCFKSSKKKN
jgi:hypothetical protein